ncbi:hypothetical protein PMIN02_003922 [Paraphaeosphaeria minitans]
MFQSSCPRHTLHAVTASWAILASTAAANLLQMPVTRTIPITDRGTTMNTSDDPHRNTTMGESPTSRTLFLSGGLMCVALLTGVLGYRVNQIEHQHIRSLNLTRILVVILGCLAISFVSSATIVESGLGLSTSTVCHAAIIICLAFYVSCKAVMYIFLVERAHALRAPYMKRSRDWIWLGGMTTIACGFGSIAICGFMWPIANLSEIDGRCRIGLPFRVTIPLLSFDVVINTLLTGIFVHLLRPLLRFNVRANETAPTAVFASSVRRVLKRSHGRANSLDVYAMNHQSFKSIERLLWKSLTGSILVMLPTVGNLVVLIPLHGQELGWVCLTICAFDVTWSVLVVNWLTIGSTEFEGRPLVMLAQPESANSACYVLPQLPSQCQMPIEAVQL